MVRGTTSAATGTEMAQARILSVSQALPPHFVVIVRREAIEGAGRLEEAIVAHMRPFLDDAVAFLSREVEAGRLRPHDPIELMQLCYGAMLTYFSDARFRSRLLGDDPLGAAERTRFQTALTSLLRAALDPAG